MRKFLLSVLACSILCSFTLGANAAEVVRTSIQPCLHGLPVWMAAEGNDAKSLPFELKHVLFPSGGPQIEALAAGASDIAVLGVPAALMANLRYGAIIIAVSNDESETNDLWVRPDSPLLKTKGAVASCPELYGKPEDWKGKKILTTTVSTGHYALAATLKVLGLTEKDVSVIHIEQGQAITAFESGQGDILQLWAPFDYIGEGKGWVKVSSGRRVGVTIPGAVIVTKEFAAKKPDLVVAWLDVYMRGIEKMKSDPQGTIPLLDKFFKTAALKLPDGALEKEFQLRPLYSVGEEVELLSNPAKMPAWMAGVAQFFLDQKRISQAEMDKLAKANFFVEPAFMKKLAEQRAAKQ
jgi:ABC-type nitrate/sulfonate/bicarbonate transport system substrate-binding protein